MDVGVNFYYSCPGKQISESLSFFCSQHGKNTHCATGESNINRSHNPTQKIIAEFKIFPSHIQNSDFYLSHTERPAIKEQNYCQLVNPNVKNGFGKKCCGIEAVPRYKPKTEQIHNKHKEAVKETGKAALVNWSQLISYGHILGGWYFDGFGGHFLRQKYLILVIVYARIEIYSSKPQ